MAALNPPTMEQIVARLPELIEEIDRLGRDAAQRYNEGHVAAEDPMEGIVKLAGLLSAVAQALKVIVDERNGS